MARLTAIDPEHTLSLRGREQIAFVRGRAGRLFLPGGGMGPGERPEDALMREILEAVGWSVRILSTIGRATQFVFAAGEGYFAIRATSALRPDRVLDERVLVERQRHQLCASVISSSAPAIWTPLASPICGQTCGDPCRAPCSGVT